MTNRRFRIGMALVGLVSLTIRVLHVALNKADTRLRGDALDYYSQAQSIIDAHAVHLVRWAQRSY